MSIKKYKNFSQQELQKIINSSCTRKEALIKMGYANSVQSQKIIEIAKEYNLDISGLKSGPKEKWMNFTKEEIIEIMLSSTSYREAIKKLGYLTTDNSMDYKVKELSKKYNISLNHFIKTGSLIGKRIGLLLVKGVSKRKDGSGNKYYYVECECSPGILREVSAYSLRSGHTKSCGCLKSYGEYKTTIVLNSLGISFFKEYSFPDLLSDKNKALRFDFFLPDLNILIECQGRQHYEKTGGYMDSDFEKRQQRDKMKKNIV